MTTTPDFGTPEYTRAFDAGELGSDARSPHDAVHETPDELDSVRDLDEDQSAALSKTARAELDDRLAAADAPDQLEPTPPADLEPPEPFVAPTF